MMETGDTNADFSAPAFLSWNLSMTVKFNIETMTGNNETYFFIEE